MLLIIQLNIRLRIVYHELKIVIIWEFEYMFQHVFNEQYITILGSLFKSDNQELDLIFCSVD